MFLMLNKLDSVSKLRNVFEEDGSHTIKLTTMQDMAADVLSAIVEEEEPNVYIVCKETSDVFIITDKD